VIHLVTHRAEAGADLRNLHLVFGNGLSFSAICAVEGVDRLCDVGEALSARGGLALGLAESRGALAIDDLVLSAGMLLAKSPQAALEGFQRSLGAAIAAAPAGPFARNPSFGAGGAQPVCQPGSSAARHRSGLSRFDMRAQGVTTFDPSKIIPSARQRPSACSEQARCSDQPGLRIVGGLVGAASIGSSWRGSSPFFAGRGIFPRQREGGASVELFSTEATAALSSSRPL